MSNKLAIEYLNGPGPIKWLSSPIEEWENNHDFIQWLFPTSTPSKFNPYAPVLTSHIGVVKHTSSNMKLMVRLTK